MDKDVLKVLSFMVTLFLSICAYSNMCVCVVSVFVSTTAFDRRAHVSGSMSPPHCQINESEARLYCNRNMDKTDYITKTIIVVLII